MAPNILVLGLLLYAVVSPFSTVLTNAGTTYQANGKKMGEMAELEGSIARFRDFIAHEEFSFRNLLQVDEEKLDGLQEKGSMEQFPEQETTDEDREERRKSEEDERFAEGDEHTELEIANKDLNLVHSENTGEREREQHKNVEGKEAQTEDEPNPAEGKSNFEEEKPLSETQEHQQHHEEQNPDEGKSNFQPEEKPQSETEEQQNEAEQNPAKRESNFEEENPQSETEGQEQQHEAEQNPTKRKSNFEEEKTEDAFVFPEPYLLGPNIKDWDEQRESWLNENPHMKTNPDGKPRVLIVTGSQPWPCRSSVGDHFHVKALKLKIDYARMHNYEIYYNLVWLDPLFGGFWVKLPTIRALMLTHPEIEWFFWVDSDATFTDMLFEAPWASYEGYNMVMWGINDFFYAEKAWTGFNAGVFMLRNCQWTLDLIDKWSPMGPEGPVRDAYGKILTAFLPGRNDWAADDQGALAYLMINDEAIKAKVKLVDSDEYMISGWWIPIVDTYEELMEKYHPGLGNHKWPWITHFTGCGPCHQDETTEQFKNCMKNFDRAFNFADNQVLAYMGFQHEDLNSSDVIRVRNETDRPLDLLGVNPWAERIAKVAASVGKTSQ